MVWVDSNTIIVTLWYRKGRELTITVLCKYIAFERRIAEKNLSLSASQKLIKHQNSFGIGSSSGEELFVGIKRMAQNNVYTLC